MRTYRLLWGSVAALLLASGLAAGLVTLSVQVWLIVAAPVILLWLLLSTAVDDVDERRSLRRRKAQLAFVAYLVIIATPASATLLDLGALAVLALVLASSPAAVRWCRRRLGSSRSSSQRLSTVLSTGGRLNQT